MSTDRWWCLLRRRWQDKFRWSFRLWRWRRNGTAPQVEKKKLKKKEKKSTRSKSWSSSTNTSKAIPDRDRWDSWSIDELNKLKMMMKDTQQSISGHHTRTTDDTLFSNAPDTHIWNSKLAPNTTGPIWPQPSQQQHPRPLTAARVIFAGKQGTAFAGVSSVRTWFSWNNLMEWSRSHYLARRVNIARGFQRKYPYSSQSGISPLDEINKPICATTTTQEVGPNSRTIILCNNGQVFVSVRGRRIEPQGRKPMKTPNEGWYSTEFS